MEVVVVDDVVSAAGDVLTLGRVPTATRTATATTKTTSTAAALGTDSVLDVPDGGSSDSTSIQPAVRPHAVQAFALAVPREASGGAIVWPGARVAQSVERFTCNEDVAGSIPASGSSASGSFASGSSPQPVVRWRATSKQATAAATPTLSEGSVPCCGMATTASQRRRTRGANPFSSPPTTRATGPSASGSS